MGLGGIGPWQLLIVLLIVVVIFGTSRLKSIGSDLGSALKSFRKAMDTDDEKERKASEDSEHKRLEGEKPDAEFAEQKDKAGHG